MTQTSHPTTTTWRRRGGSRNPELVVASYINEISRPRRNGGAPSRTAAGSRAPTAPRRPGAPGRPATAPGSPPRASSGDCALLF